MAKYYYNGVLLPEIPADTLENEPYVYIDKDTSSNVYRLVSQAAGVYFSLGKLRPGQAKTIYKISIENAESATEWSSGQYNTSAQSIGTETRTMVWSNFDIPNGSADATEIYFYASEPVPESGEDGESGGDTHIHSYIETVTIDPTCTVNGIKTYLCECGDTYTKDIPATGHNYANGICVVCGSYDPDYVADEYRIKRETLVGIGDEVRRLCNIDNVVTPPQMHENLSKLNIELTEAYVSATETEQIITPDEGYYGFSKITVGAVDLSGGGGGDGEGEEDEEIEYAEDVTSWEEKGNLTFTDTTGSVYNLPPLPVECYKTDNCYFVQKLEDSDGAVYFVLTITKDEIGFHSGSNDPLQANVWYQFECTSSAWVQTFYASGTGGTSKIAKIPKSTIVLANCTLYDTNGDVLSLAGRMEIEEVKVVTFSAVERDELYTISGDTLNVIGMAVQALTGSGLLTPGGMASALGNMTSDTIG